MSLVTHRIEKIASLDGDPVSGYTPLAGQYDTTNFDELLGDIKVTQERRRVEAREGVDGFRIVELGRRGSPFQLSSLVHFANPGDCFEALARYQDFAGIDVGCAVTQADLLLFPVDVLEVQMLRTPRRVAWFRGPVSGFMSQPWELRAQWTMIARAV